MNDLSHRGRQEVSMGGIGEVSTKPQFRGKGFASLLLKVSHQRLEINIILWRDCIGDTIATL
jgi:predicted acetyltransferase